MNATNIRNYWKKLSGLKQGNSITLRVNDFWPLQDLMEEEKRLRRREVKELISLRRDKAWYIDQINKGNKPIFCQHYNRHHFADKTCYTYRFKRSGPPELLVTTSPSSVQMRAAPVQPDLNKLREERERIQQLITKQQQQEQLKTELEELQKQHEARVEQKK